MKHLYFLLALIICSSLYAQTANLRFVEITNDQTLNGTFEVKVQINTSAVGDPPTVFKLGNANLIMNYNFNALSFPSSPSSGNDYVFHNFTTNPYFAGFVTNNGDGLLYLNIEYSELSAAEPIAVVPSWTDVVTLNFIISDPTLSSGLVWSSNPNPPPSFDIFLDDNSTQFTKGTLQGLDNPLPVELTNFTAANSDADVNLNWETATEVDNYGFEIERALNMDEKVWENIGFINGYGNSNSPKDYSYVDHSPIGGNKFVYRLKQVDNDGTYTYSDVVEVEIIPNRYELYQNYPNPFNPSTTIRFSLKETQDVKVVIFDQLGQEVRTIVNQKYDAGYHEFEYNASGIASGVYFYRIIAGDFVNVKKMMLLK